MIEILEQAVNLRNGLTILRTNRKGWDEMVTLPKGQTAAQWLANAREQESRAEGQAAIAAQDRQIEAEVLRAGPGVIARQDTRTGKTAVFLEPGPGPVATPTPLPSEGNVPDQASSLDELKALREKAAKLQTTVDDPGASQDAKATAQSELDPILSRILVLETALRGPTQNMRRTMIEYERDAHGHLMGARKRRTT